MSSKFDCAVVVLNFIIAMYCDNYQTQRACTYRQFARYLGRTVGDDSGFYGNEKYGNVFKYWEGCKLQYNDPDRLIEQLEQKRKQSGKYRFVINCTRNQSVDPLLAGTPHPSSWSCFKISYLLIVRINRRSHPPVPKKKDSSWKSQTLDCIITSSLIWTLTLFFAQTMVECAYWRIFHEIN